MPEENVREDITTEEDEDNDYIFIYAKRRWQPITANSFLCL